MVSVLNWDQENSLTFGRMFGVESHLCKRLFRISNQKSAKVKDLVGQRYQQPTEIFFQKKIISMGGRAAARFETKATKAADLI